MSVNRPASAHSASDSRQRSGGPPPASPSANVRGVTPSPAAAQATPISAPAHARNDSRQRSGGLPPASPSAHVRGVTPSPAAAALQTSFSASSIGVAPGPYHPPPPSPTVPAPSASHPSASQPHASQLGASQLGAFQLGASQPGASQPHASQPPPAPPPYAPPNANWVHVRANPLDPLPDILVPDPGDPARPFNYRSVTCLPEYAHVSFEELRWYTREGKPPPPPPTQPQQALQQPPQRFQLAPQRFQLSQQPPQPPQHYHWDTPEGQRLWQHASTGSAASIPTLPSQPVQPLQAQAQQQQQQPTQPPTQPQRVLQQQAQPFQQLQQPFQHPFQQPQQPQQPQQNYHGNTPEGQRLRQHVASNGSAASIATLPSQPVQPPTPNRLQYLAPNGIAGIPTLVSSPVQPPQPIQPSAPVGLVILPSGNVCTLADIVEIQKQVMEGLELLREPAPADQEAEAADSDDDERSPSPPPRRKHRHRDKQSSNKLRHRVKRIEKMLDRLLLESETADTPSPSVKQEAASTSAPPEDEPAPLLREAVPQEQNLGDEGSKGPMRDDVFSLIALHGEPLATSEHDGPSTRTRDPSSISSTFASIMEFTRCPEVRDFLKRAARFPGLRSTQLFNFPWVLDNLFDAHGGILMYWLDQSLDLMQTLVSSDSSLEVWDASLLRKIDAVYCDTLRPAIGHDGRPDDELKAAWKTYRHGVLQCLTEHAPPFDAARARALLPAEAEPFVVPILTASFVHDFNDMWCSVDIALKEIARWFEPFIDYGPDFHRRQPFHDATLTIARHIRADTALADPEQAVTLLWTFLRRERACFLAVLRAKMQHATASDAALRSQPVLPARDAHPTLRSLLASPPALAAAMELRALDATQWAWTDADWGVRLAGALREAALVRAYRPALLKIPQVEYIRGAVLAACQRSTFWDGLEAGADS